MIMHGASLMIFCVIVKYPSANSYIPFTHKFHGNRQLHHQIHQKYSPYFFQKCHYHKNRIPLGEVFALGILHHMLLRIKIANNVVKLIESQLIHLIYHGLLILRNFILTQASKEIIFATHFMMIIHGA